MALYSCVPSTQLLGVKGGRALGLPGAGAVMLPLLRQKFLKGIQLPKLHLSIFRLLIAESLLEFEWYRASQDQARKASRSKLGSAMSQTLGKKLSLYNALRGNFERKALGIT